MKTSVIEVHDMLSVWSVEEVERRIGEVPGVESVTVNYAAKNATVRYDETRLQVADIKSAVRQIGYESPGESPPTPKAESASASTPAPAAPKPSPASPAAPAGDGKKDEAAPDASPSTPVDAAPAPHPPRPLRRATVTKAMMVTKHRAHRLQLPHPLRRSLPPPSLPPHRDDNRSAETRRGCGTRSRRSRRRREKGQSSAVNTRSRCTETSPGRACCCPRGRARSARSRRPPGPSCPHGGGFPETVLDLAGPDPADSRPLADAPNAGGTARSHPFSRRPLRPVRPFFRGLLVWRLAVSQRLFRGTQIPPARDDDAHLRRHRHGVSLQQRRGVRPDRQDVLLGAGHPRRHHVARALDRDEVRDGRFAGFGGAGQTHALRRAQAHARRQREGRAARRTGGG